MCPRSHKAIMDGTKLASDQGGKEVRRQPQEEKKGRGVSVDDNRGPGLSLSPLTLCSSQDPEVEARGPPPSVPVRTREKEHKGGRKKTIQARTRHSTCAQHTTKQGQTEEARSTSTDNPCFPCFVITVRDPQNGQVPVQTPAFGHTYAARLEEAHH